MESYQSTYHSPVYREFRAIPPADQREIIHFFERNETKVRAAYPEEIFEMVAVYCEALYDTNAFRKFLVVADEVIERSIRENIVTFRKRDIYRWMLERKARAHLRLLEGNAAEHVLRELLRMNPRRESYIRLLGRCYYRQKPEWVRQARAVSVLLFLIAAAVTAVEVLFVTPLTPDWTNEISAVRTTIFLVGLLILVGSDLLHRYRIRQRIRAYRRAAANKHST